MSHQDQRWQATETRQPTQPFPEDMFTRDEWNALVALRECHAPDYDVLGLRECTRLHFVRWLVQTGRIQP
jgi:hypothetical protein